MRLLGLKERHVGSVKRPNIRMNYIRAPFDSKFETFPGPNHTSSGTVVEVGYPRVFLRTCEIGALAQWGTFSWHFAQDGSRLTIAVNKVTMLAE